MALTTFKYGSYTTAEGAARLVSHEVEAAMTERNNRWGEWRRLHVEIELQATGQDLKDEIDELTTAFSQNDRSGGLYWPDGTVTPHFLDQNDSNNWSGVKVVYRNWIDSDPGQLVNARTAKIVLQALFRNPDSLILKYRDDVEVHGDGGRDWEWVVQPTGDPIQQDISLFTPQLVTQTGFIYALDAWAYGNIPPPVLAGYEKRKLRRIRRLYPRWFGNAFGHHGLGWSYIMQTPPGYPVPTQAQPY